MFGSMRLSSRAQVAPPKPPPTTTTRGEPCATAGIAAPAAAAAIVPRRNRRRVWRPVTRPMVRVLPLLPPRPTDPRLSRKRAVAARATAPSRLHHGDVVVLERERADPLARRPEVGVEHGGSRHADRRLADAAPEATGRHDDRLDLRHLGDTH